MAHYNSTDASIRAYRDSLSEDDASRLLIVQADLTSESAVQALFCSIDESAIPPIVALVVNHGIWPSNIAPLASMSLTQWNKTLNTNLTSSFLIIREYLQKLKVAIGNKTFDRNDDRISVVLVGSTAGKYGEADHGDYAASKSGELIYSSKDGLRTCSLDIVA